jgi:hypothetical protein
MPGLAAQCETETAAVAETFRFQPYIAAVYFDDALYQGQAHAGTLDVQTQSFEQFKYQALLLGCDADAVIPDEETGFPLALFCTDTDLWPMLVTPQLDRVLEQVLLHLEQPGSVSPDLGHVLDLGHAGGGHAVALRRGRHASPSGYQGDRVNQLNPFGVRGSLFRA